MSKPPGSKRLPGESGIVKAVREHREQVEKFMSQCVADVQGYASGVTEQLMLQVGQMMTVQAALIEYLQELSVRRRDDVFAEVRIEAIVTQNIAKAKAEREAREAEKKAEAIEVAKEACEVTAAELGLDFSGLDRQVAPADIVPASPADEAPAQPVEGS